MNKFVRLALSIVKSIVDKDFIKQQVVKFYYPLSFLFFGIILHLFYEKTMRAGFVFDMTEWLSDYIKYPNFDYLKPPFDNNLRPIYHLILYNTYKFFGVKYKAWYALSSGLYWITSCLILVFFSKFYQLFRLESAPKLALVSAFAFVITPFGTEVVVWYPTIHYQIVFICLFSSLIFILHYRNQIIKTALPVNILFLIAILCIELSYSILPICLALILLLVWYQKTEIKLKSYIYWILIPQILIFVAYNIICAAYYDKFLGHYSIGKTDFSYVHLALHFIKIYIKHLTLINHTGIHIYQPFFEGMDKYWYLILGMFIGGIVFLFFKFKRIIFKLSERTGVKIFLFASSFLLYVPISFLFFHNWKEIELDRLGLGMMIFGISLFVLFIYELQSIRLRHLILISYFGFSMIMLQDYTTRWQKSAQVRDSFSNNLPLYNGKRVYVLAAPILMNYTYLFAINDSMELHRHIRIFKGKEPLSDYRFIVLYNMSDIDDMVTADKVDDMTVHISVKKWGNWCWHNLKDAIKPVETNKYKLIPDADNLGYSIAFKSLDSNDKLLLFNHLNFKEVDLKSKEVGHIYL